MGRWVIQLQKDDYFHAVFLQKGIHVAVTVLGPDNKIVARVNSLNGDWGPEPIFFVAPQDGAYNLVGVTPGDAAAKGSIEFSVSDLRPATEKR